MMEHDKHAHLGMFFVFCIVAAVLWSTLGLSSLHSMPRWHCLHGSWSRLVVSRILKLKYIRHTWYYCPPCKSTGFHWIPVDSCGLQWTPNSIYLYGTPYNFWELDWTGVLSESTEIPVLLESCGLEPTELQGNPQDLTGLKGNPLDYLIIVKYIFISTCGDSNKVMYFVQLAGSGHVTIFT